jgi:hypothetical protein
MTRMARGVCDLKRPSTCVDLLAPPEHGQMIVGHRFNHSPEAIHLIAVQPRCARNELAWIKNMRRTLLVHEHLDVRMTTNDCAGRAGMIEVNVRQQQMCDVVETQTA